MAVRLKSFAPNPSSVDAAALGIASARLLDFFKSKDKIAVITGAGCSTESGIPDYRSPNGSYSRGHKPILHSEFVNNMNLRRRYWARSILGYRVFSKAQPNQAHRSLANIESKTEKISAIITQNVDGLHEQAGSKNIIKLHGDMNIVKCLECKSIYSRLEFQKRLEHLNPLWVEEYEKILITENDNAIRADGDVEINADYENFQVPVCENCGHNALKPDVVFFGDHVPSAVVSKANDEIQNANAVLILGSSMQVWSAYRLATLAHSRQIPIGIVNIGDTRADALSKFKIPMKLGDILQIVEETL